MISSKTKIDQEFNIEIETLILSGLSRHLAIIFTSPLNYEIFVMIFRDLLCPIWGPCDVTNY